MGDATDNFDILTISLNILRILIVQQNYFSDLYVQLKFYIFQQNRFPRVAYMYLCIR